MAEAVDAAGSPVELIRDLGVAEFTELPDEFTHRIEEQRSWRESVAFADQSYHMTDHYVEGPDARAFYSAYAVNSFENAAPGTAKQLVVANPDGEFIGDAILFVLDDDEFLSVGAAAAHNWLQYHVETGDYDVSGEIQGRPVSTGKDPNNFRFQLQGPNAVDVMEAAADDPLPDLGFFEFDTVSVAGRDVNLLRHGMAGESGFEFWGPYESDDVADYYFTPPELGYGPLVGFDHDFVGKEALRAEVDDPEREKVTLVWDGEDVVDVFASLFSDGETQTYVDMPHPRWAACPYDEVFVDGEHVGVSTDKSYVYNERELISLAVVDTVYSDPGTEVTLVWGEPADNENPKVERHAQTEIGATVAPVPYREDRR